MNADDALNIVRDLADGRNPISHDALEHSVLTYPEISDALELVMLAAKREFSRSGEDVQNPQKPVSRNVDDELREELNTGLTVGVIARMHRLSMTLILEDIVRLGLAESNEDALRKFGGSRPSSSNVHKTVKSTDQRKDDKKGKRLNSGTPWTVEEDERLRKEFSAGLSIFEIARAHLRSTGAISSRLLQIGMVNERYEAFKPPHQRLNLSH